jgi:nitric oxide synthase oxygenase domain/subunit
MNFQKYELEQTIGSDMGRKALRTDLEQAIKSYQQALIALTTAATPIEWAETMRCLGEIYVNCLVDSQVRDVGQTIDFYENALSVLTAAISLTDQSETIHRSADVHDNDKAEVSFQQAIKTNC